MSRSLSSATGDFPVVQWLRHHASTAGGHNFDLCRENKDPTCSVVQPKVNSVTVPGSWRHGGFQVEYERKFLAMHYRKVRTALRGVKSRQMHKPGGSSHHFIFHRPVYSVLSLFNHDMSPETAEGPQKLTLPVHKNPPAHLTFNDLASLPAPPTPAKTQHFRSL